VLLRFPHELDPVTSTNTACYKIDRWNYERSHKYGSGHYKLDGTPGHESLPVAGVCLSRDHTAVFLGIPDMQPSHSLRVTYRVARPEAQPVIQHAYLTVHQLRAAKLPALGFDDIEINLHVDPSTTADLPRPAPSAEEGQKVATMFGCFGCHRTDHRKAVNPDPNMVVGPSWRGLFGSQRELTDGFVIKKADEIYLRESILDPSRRVVKGFETGKTGVGMPSYLGVLDDGQIESVILFIKSLREQ
jgi:hypothetical protein